jgi:hypothetical protein
VILFLSYNNIFSQEINIKNRFINTGKIWDESDKGIIIPTGSPFTHPYYYNVLGRL